MNFSFNLALQMMVTTFEKYKREIISYYSIHNFCTNLSSTLLTCLNILKPFSILVYISWKHTDNFIAIKLTIFACTE